MTVTEIEYRSMAKVFEGHTFIPKANLIEEETEVNGEKQKIFKYEILKTANEVYQEYLNPPASPPTKEEILEKQLLETQAILASLQEQILLKSNGGM